MEQKILEYLSQKALPVLDDSIRTYYNSVTLSYLAEYVCHSSESEVASTLIKLIKEEKVFAMYCGHLSEIVFRGHKLSNWFYDPVTGKGKDSRGMNVFSYLGSKLQSEETHLSLESNNR